MNEELKLMVIPVMVGILEVIKKFGLDAKYVPVISLVLGVAMSIALSNPSIEAVIEGLVYGLSACGLYSGVKATIE